MRLPEQAWADPLHDFISLYKKKGTSNVSNDLEAALSRYRQKLSHLSIIWERLRADVDAHERYLEYGVSKIKTMTPGQQFSFEDSKTIQELENASRGLYLDYEDFLIHSKILMDRVIFLTSFLFRDLEIRPPITSFTKHRKFFLEAASNRFLDEEYAEYIRDNTQWYETLLRSYRDEFIVHDRRFRSFGVMSGPAHSPRLWRTRNVDMSRWQNKWDALMALRTKYLNRIPGLERVSLNLYEIVDFLDSNSSAIQPKDLNILAEIREFVGGKLPDLIELAKYIQHFLQFFGAHFCRRLGQATAV